MGIFYESENHGVLIFLLLSIVLGGSASMAAGRALASTWRPASHCIHYAIPIAAAIAFLHYALFQESVIPLYAIGSAFINLGADTKAGIVSLLFNLRGFFALFVIHAAFALLGFRLTRTRQMAGQYSFAFKAQGPLSWRAKT
jgi:hypothetical protein